MYLLRAYRKFVFKLNLKKQDKISSYSMSGTVFCRKNLRKFILIQSFEDASSNQKSWLVFSLKQQI